MVRIGLNIHPVFTGGQQYSAEQKNYLAATLQQLRPSANLFLSSTDLMLYYASAMPESLAVMRFYHDREGDFYNLTPPPGLSMARHLFNAYSPWYKYPNVVINLGNESSSYVGDDEVKRQADFYAEGMEIFGSARVPTAISGWATGHPDLTRLHLFKPMWEMFRRYPSNMLAVHEYFSYRGAEIGNGRVGRHETLAKWLTANGYVVPNMLITEHGSDDISDDPYRGWLSWPAQIDREMRYFEFLRECRRNSYNKPWVKGVMIYSWGDSNGWPDFDISRHTRLHKWLIEENNTFMIQPPISEPPVVDEDTQPFDRTPLLIAEIKSLLDKYQ